jgi:murein DD-endopeptidase MepM/ murein hydrolase activator NlpD
VIHEGWDIQSFNSHAAVTDYEPVECISAELRAEIEQRINEYEASAGTENSVNAIEPESYPFFPHAGTVWEDLYLRNFVDLDPSPGFIDYDCGPLTYNGHTGIDSGVRSFREQDIGVPVFAALDGTVIDVRDGAFDRNTSCQPNAPVNYVILRHGTGHTTWYFHLRRGSVAVGLNQFVKAGTQLGLTGSSGCSTGPHLHFESRQNNLPYEPASGRCRPGASNWVNQIPIRRELYARDIAFSDVPFTGPADIPHDQAVRTNTYMPGFKRIFFRAELSNIPAFSTYTIAVRRPNNTVYGFFSNTFGSSFLPMASPWWFMDINLDMPGTWLVTLVIGPYYEEAYFNVVTSPSQIANRSPLAVSANLDPPAPDTDDVIFCRVNTYLAYRDPDYDVVSYRYQWSINGRAVRDVTYAALSDAIPKGMARPGDRVTCTVRPYDGRTFGAAATASVTIPGGASPSIGSASFNGKKKLTISGQGFSSSPRVFINNADKTDRINSSSDSVVKLKGKASALGLRSGENTIQVFHASGAGSNLYRLRL